MATPVLNYISEPDYLEAERKSFDKHTYHKAEVFARKAALLPYNDIFYNIFVRFGPQLTDKNRNAYGSDVKIHNPQKQVTVGSLQNKNFYPILLQSVQ